MAVVSAPVSHFSQPALSERELTELWQNQSFPPAALITTKSEPLRVIYRGRRAGGAGPDFRDAILAAPWGLLEGDVELHVRSSDFRRHGHGLDDAYNRVILHFVFNADEGETLLENGACVPVVALAAWVDGRREEIRRWLERPGAWREPCYGAVARIGSPMVQKTLDRLGDMRFRQKAAAFARRLLNEDAEQLLWEGLLEGLGYGGRRDAFRSLAQRWPWDRLRSHLLARCPAERADAARRILAASLANARPEAAQMAARPGNRPEERLTGAGRLAARFTPDGLVAGLSGCLNRDADEAWRSFRALLSVTAVIGSSRTIELLTNAVLPCLAALGPEAQTQKAEALYRRLPLPARYGAVRHLHEALAADVPLNARRQQGMLYLLRQYCSKGGCGGRCPLS